MRALGEGKCFVACYKMFPLSWLLCFILKNVKSYSVYIFIKISCKFIDFNENRKIFRIYFLDLFAVIVYCESAGVSHGGFLIWSSVFAACGA